MGGLYRDQGLEVVRKWIIPVIQPHVEAMYKNLRDDYRPEAILQPRVSAVPPPSPPSSSAPLESAAPASPSPPAQVPDDSHRNLRPRTNTPQQRSGRVGGDVKNYPRDVDKSRSNRRRRRSSQVEGRSGDSGRQRLVSSRRNRRIES